MADFPGGAREVPGKSSGPRHGTGPPAGPREEKKRRGKKGERGRGRSEERACKARPGNFAQLQHSTVDPGEAYQVRAGGRAGGRARAHRACVHRRACSRACVGAHAARHERARSRKCARGSHADAMRIGGMPARALSVGACDACAHARAVSACVHMLVQCAGARTHAQRATSCVHARRCCWPRASMLNEQLVHRAAV